jgi:hypothetical protein
MPENTISQNTENEKKRSFIFPAIIFLIIATAVLIFWYYKSTSEIKFDELLLAPKIQKPNNKINSLNEIELQSVLASFKSPKLIPKGFELPESSPEQARPTLGYLANCQEVADSFMTKEPINHQELFSPLYITVFNFAYSYTNDPKYLDFVMNEFIKIENTNLETMIAFSDILKTQREAISFTNSNNYISSIGKIKAKVIEQLGTKDPIQAINALLLANSLPLDTFKQEILQKLKPILEKAFSNENNMSKDGLFLSFEDSTSFSLKLIKLAWAYYIDKIVMPDWLYSLAEKESCRLAYRLEQDGCLPVWQKDEKRQCYTEEIYKASLIFDRDDLRYIGFCGWRLGNSYPPKQKSFDFSEIGILVFRSHWNHESNFIPPLRGFRLISPDSMQITFNQKLNMLSVSIGSLTQILFKSNKVFKSVYDLENSFNFSYYLEDEKYHFKIEIEDFDLDLIDISSPYEILANDQFKFKEISTWKDSFRKLKGEYEIQILRNDENKIKKITFTARNKL